ncbi:MAG: DUF2079 domain-containing protein [bacterium]
MERNRIVIFFPLLLLVLLNWTSGIGALAAGSAIHPDIAALRYFAVPLTGFSIGFTVFLWLRQAQTEPFRINLLAERYKFQLLIFFSAVFFLFFFSLAALRYTAYHTCSGELGWYDNKVWNISQAPSFLKAAIIAATGYFQPILLVHGYFYKLYGSPVSLQFLQTLAVVSGVIPLYLLAREKSFEEVWAIAIVLLYLLYPPVEYNAVMEFHPDHLCIPLFLWAFYLVERKRYWPAVITAGLGGLAKEPLILSAAFFGLYLFLDTGKKGIGISSFVFYLTLFLLVIFLVQPHLTRYYKKIGNVMQGSNFSYLDPANSRGALDYVSKLMGGLATWKSKKILLAVFLLAPFLFIPLIRGGKFIPALPSLSIAFLSLFPYHAAVDLQYTAGVIPSVFAGLIFALSRIRKRFGEKKFTALFLWIFIMTLTFNVAHSPSPLSPNFWNDQWSAVWYHGTYKKTPRARAIEELAMLIPSDPTVKLAVQYNINTARLSHRINYWVFPGRYREADYLLLDTRNPVIPVDVRYTPTGVYTTDKYFTAKKLYENEYERILNEINNSGKFRIVKEKDGLLLFKTFHDGPSVTPS